MPNDLVYPTSAELDEIARDKLPRLTADRPCFDIFPMKDEDNALVMWEQRDNFYGLQQLRGLNGEPPKVRKLGARRFQMEPGFYGEFIPIDETELTLRRQYGSFGTPVDVSDLVMDAQDQLLERRLDRLEWIIWTLLVTGTFAVSTALGTIAHTDVYNFQQYTAGTTWATAATSTPLADLRAIKLLARGHSVSFGPDSYVYLNQVTMNNVLSNTNNADIYGRRTAGLGTFNSEQQVNQLFSGDGLPTFMVYDEGYLNELVGVWGAGAAAGTQTGATITTTYGAPLVGSQIILDKDTNVQEVTTITAVAGGPTSWTVTFITTKTHAANATVGGFYTPFIPNNKAIVVGKRPAGQPLGEYKMTRNANNPGLAPGAYQKVIDRRDQHVPATIEVHDGHNGGPALFFPSAIVVMNV